MKTLICKVICVIVIVLYATMVSGQIMDSSQVIIKNDSTNIFKDKRFSVELFVDYPLYFLHSPDHLYSTRIKYNNYWNYGGGILISKYFRSIKLETGFYYSTCNYYHKFQTTSSSIIDKIDYWNIPIVVSVKVWRFSPFLGVVISKPFHYNNLDNEILRKEINTLNYHPSPGGGPGPSNNNLNMYFLSSTSLLVGLSYNQKVYNSLYLNVKLSYSYKSFEDVFMYAGPLQPAETSFVEGRSSIYFNFGVEYVFFNKKK